MRVVAVAAEADDRELRGADDVPAGAGAQRGLGVLGERDAVRDRLAERGQPVLRLCTINPRTTFEDVERTIERMEELSESCA